LSEGKIRCLLCCSKIDGVKLLLFCQKSVQSEHENSKTFDTATAMQEK